MAQISLNSLGVNHLQLEEDQLDGQDDNFFMHTEEWRGPLESVFKETKDFSSLRNKKWRALKCGNQPMSAFLKKNLS